MLVQRKDFSIPTPAQLASMIDHTLLRAFASQAEIDTLCVEAERYRFANVTINPAWTSYCVKRLKGTGVGINPTIGFPLGANTANIKLKEAEEVLEKGATELDMVINIGALKSGFPKYVEQEIAAIAKVSPKTPLKVILEASYLTDAEKVDVCKMSEAAGASFVKTSTGFGDSGATVHDVRLMCKTVGKTMGVKAAGGIRGYLDTEALLRAGATRIGSSAGIKILSEIPQHRASA